MSEAAAAQSKPLPVVSFLKIPDQGKPYLEGQRCKGCKAVFLGVRDVCASCGARNQFEQIKLADKGELYVYSITYRSFPGIETPFISAVVDLEGGGTVKGNLIGIDADPKKIKMGMPVEVVYKTAPRKDREGNEYLTYYFQPAKA
jgi:uncharacterized OB-fold protein